jgi:hypothetical protein
MAEGGQPRSASRRTAEQRSSAVAAYKSVLKRVFDNRPSGTRHRLAHALATNRSFISQITNSAYTTPIPAQHLETLFEVCHFTADERREFLEHYGRAHPRRLAVLKPRGKQRRITIEVPDLGDVRRNRLLDETIADVARRVARLIEEG